MSLPARRAKRIDANQPEIVRALRKVGCAAWVVGSPFDVLCGLRGRFYTLEIKDGAKPESKRKLTPEEQAYLHTCRAMGLPHFVVTSVSEALQAVGVT